MRGDGWVEGLLGGESQSAECRCRMQVGMTARGAESRWD